MNSQRTLWEKFEFVTLLVFAIAWTAMLGYLVVTVHNLPPIPQQCFNANPRS